MLTRATYEPPPEATPAATATARRIAATVVALCAAGTATTWAPDNPVPARQVAPPLAGAAHRASTDRPLLIAFTVPTKHPKHSQDSGDDDDSDTTSDSGNTSVSNTVNGHEVGGARTYNNHTDTYDDSD